MKVLLGLFVLGISVFMAGCTIPSYERTVTNTYDGQGVLQSTVVTENVRQVDPNAKPLLPVLRNQTYQKKP